MTIDCRQPCQQRRLRKEIPVVTTNPEPAGALPNQAIGQPEVPGVPGQDARHICELVGVGYQSSCSSR
jgi:hypothetical protein